MKLYSLQALRAAAAWLVVADHSLLEITRNDPENILTSTAWAMGSSGVYVFFVISGFIMVHISWDDFGQKGASANFLRRRIIRIVPFYWLATITALGFHQISVTHGANAGWPELIRSLLFIPYPDESARWSPILSQGWTLSYEMMFYGLFALALALSRRLALVAITGGLGALSVAGSMFPPGVVAHLASPIILWFVLGVTLGAIWRWRRLAEPRSLARRLRYLELFGNASYSTYLVHGLILTLLVRILASMTGAVSTLIVPIGLAVATIGGCLIHVFIEKPILRVTTDLWNSVDDAFRGLGIRRRLATARSVSLPRD